MTARAVFSEARPLTPDEIAHRWGCSGETVRSLIRKGELPAFRVGRMFRVTPAGYGQSTHVYRRYVPGLYSEHGFAQVHRTLVPRLWAPA